MSVKSLLSRGEASFDFYPYNPSNAAGYFFVVVYAIITSTQLVLLVRYRTWFCVPLFLGCLAETGGYYGRAWAHNNRRFSDPYLLQLFLIIGASPLISASIYMALPRLSRTLTQGKRRMRWMSKIYILLDVICLVLQIMGTVMQAYGSGKTKQNSTRYIAGGLIFQLLAFLIYMIMVATLHRRLRHEPPSMFYQHDSPRWWSCFYALYAASFLISIRSLVRVVEFLQGSQSSIASHEAYLYLFDAAPMFLAVTFFAVWHPARVIRFDHKQKHNDIDQPLS
ncbi:putative RTA1 domain protein [Myriangium duriaei CBS 260.36]|uniref:RTA1 domain protein n=1 Tax=Myriangium duriaei CBS 260.36 TaxID=1168546 RepID=A0A9P4J175_9PEZI|nr:putative RTA1 domain protein [Myriangium duriaei CBS 260.36]